MKTGVYRHYKGNYYFVHGTGHFSENRSVEAVIYRSLVINKVWIRPYEIPTMFGDDCWMDLVHHAIGVTEPRFTYVRWGLCLRLFSFVFGWAFVIKILNACRTR